MTGGDLRLSRGTGWDRRLGYRRSLRSGRRRRRRGRSWVLRGRGRNRSGCRVRIRGNLTRRCGRRDADHRLAQATRRGRNRRGLRCGLPLDRVRAGRRRVGRARLRAARRRHADHRAAKALLWRRDGKPHYRLIEADQPLTAAHASHRFRRVLRSAMRARLHRAHYTPGPAPATKSPRGPADCKVFVQSRPDPLWERRPSPMLANPTIARRDAWVGCASKKAQFRGSRSSGLAIGARRRPSGRRATSGCFFRFEEAAA